MSTQLNNFDISRGRDNEVSKEMKLLIYSTGSEDKDKERVYNLIDGKRSTQDIADILGKPINKISGRFTQLKLEKRIRFVQKIGCGHSKFSIYEKTNVLTTNN